MRLREIANTPYRGARPKLPRGLAPETRRWWDTITRLPHASIWTDADWEVALVAARLHSRFVRTGTGANELRARESALGVTAIDRAKLRIVLVDPSTGSREPVVFYKPPPRVDLGRAERPTRRVFSKDEKVEAVFAEFPSVAKARAFIDQLKTEMQLGPYTISGPTAANGGGRVALKVASTQVSRIHEVIYEFEGTRILRAGRER